HSGIFFIRSLSSPCLMRSAITGQRVTPENRFATPKRAAFFTGESPPDSIRCSGDATSLRKYSRLPPFCRGQGTAEGFFANICGIQPHLCFSALKTQNLPEIFCGIEDLHSAC